MMYKRFAERLSDAHLIKIQLPEPVAVQVLQ